jgi:RNA polymerase sigma-70 factor (ECF subfamily)
MNEPTSLAHLAADARWVRALAHSLVADPALADDLVQDTWLAACQSGERPAGPRRGWLRTILRRKLFERRREQAARVDRERHSARREALPSTLEIVERAAVHRDLVQAVLELDEPYRTTVLCRYFDELSPREIAERTGAPVATVHTRLARAIEKLRARLDRSHGGEREAWLPALFVLAHPARHATHVQGALLMKTTMKVAIVLAALCSTIAVWRAVRRDPLIAGTESALPVHAAEEAAKPADARTPFVEIETPSERSAAASEPPAIATAAVAKIEKNESRELRGRVLDEHGLGRGGVHLGASLERSKDAPECTSGPDGRFAMNVRGPKFDVISIDERFATVLAGSGNTNGEALVVVAPRVDLAGVVADEDGLALHGAELSIEIPSGFGADFGMPLDASVRRAWKATSDDAGRFTLANVPALDRAELRVTLGGFVAHEEPLPVYSSSSVRVVLVRAPIEANRLRGIVVDSGGARVRGARVALGAQTMITDAGGRFDLDGAQTPRPDHITAVARGLQPATLALEAAKGQSEIVLRLGETTLAMSGHVLDGEDRPIAKARVWIGDPTFFGLVENEPVHVETLAGSGARRLWAYVEADEHGAFELDGLSAREYRVVACDPRTLLRVDSPLTAAGTKDITLRLPKDSVYPKLSGRVVTPSGDGVAGVNVKIGRETIAVEFPPGAIQNDWIEGGIAVTDAHGNFELTDVPREGVALIASGDPILAAGGTIDSHIDPKAVRIIAHLRMHLQVELDAPLDRADDMRVLDENGRPVLLRVMRGESSHADFRADVTDGRSQVLSLSDHARTLVLSKQGIEVMRIGLQLIGGTVNTVRW